MFVLGRKIAAIIHSEAGIIFITFAIVELENFLQLGKHLMCDSQTIHTRREREREGRHRNNIKTIPRYHTGLQTDKYYSRLK